MINVLGIPAMNDHEALSNFVDALRIAEAAAKQMAFYTDQPAWIIVEHQLGTMRERAVALAQRGFVL